MKVIVRCLILVAAATNVQGQGWRGIVPLHSSCDDVKEKLGIAECLNRTYDVLDAKASILFSDGTCSSGWNAPAGTVISLDVYSKAPQKFSDLSLDATKYRKVTNDHLPGLIRYENDDRSVSITVSADGLVMSYFYGPSEKDRSLKCQPRTEPPGDGAIKFDEYGDISRTAEEVRLKNFAFQLRVSEKSFIGYIRVYRGRSVSPEEVQERGLRAKGYLVRQGVAATRLMVVDGGLREELTFELFVVKKDRIRPTHMPTISRDRIKQ